MQLQLACFCCFSSTLATLELAAVIEPLGIIIASGTLASGKHSEQVFVVLHHFSVRYFKRAISKYNRTKNIWKYIFGNHWFFLKFLETFPSKNFPLYSMYLFKYTIKVSKLEYLKNKNLKN